MSNVNLYSAFS